MPLIDPDESRCALIVREMLRGGDWIVPHLKGEVYWDKPAPFFWLAAGARLLTGNVELGGRLIAALAGLLGVLITYVIGRRMFGAMAGFLAGLFLATSVEYFFIARWYRMDMPFATAMLAAIWWFWRAEDRRPQDTGRKAGWYGFYVFCGLATLFKGPLGLVLPAMVVGAYLLLSGRPRRFLDIFHVGGILLYLAVAAPWYVAISLREPDYAYEFFILQNFARFAGHTFVGHAFSWIVYLPILLAGLLPWTIYLPGVCIRYFPRRWGHRHHIPAMLFLWVSALVPLVFFTLSKTKLVGYILPAFAPLAVMIGALVANWISSQRSDRLMKVGVWAMLVTVLIVPLAFAAAEISLGSVDLWLAVPVAAGILGVWAMLACLRRGNRYAFVGWAVTVVFTLLVYMIVHTASAGYDLMSTRSLARLIQPQDVKDGLLCFLGKSRLSFIIYTNADHFEQFDEAHSDDLQRLADLMASERKVFCLVSGDQSLAELLKTAKVPMFFLGQRQKRWLVTNHLPR
ncbi:MAG: glycosyltransferase family 39 protein [Planctomycetes bacterium]|nr:glycosyltransferase family 39 protein [Planctomycetota bacterium]